MTIESTTTMASGLVNRKSLRAICVANGLIREAKLLDVPQSSEAFLYVFLRGVAFFGWHDFFDFFFQHVDHELIHRLVSCRVGALLHFLKQFAFDLYFVRSEHSS